MNKTFCLYDTSSAKALITIGKKGFKITYQNHVPVGQTLYVLYKKINRIFPMEIYSMPFLGTYKKIFYVECATLELPKVYKIREIPIIINGTDNSDIIRNLLIDGHKKASIKKDKILGITNKKNRE
jgi:hypothetical protein